MLKRRREERKEASHRLAVPRERQLRAVLVVEFADEKEARGEAVAEILTPRDALGRGESFVDEVESGEQEQRLVRTLVRTPLLHRCGAGMEVVEPFNGGVGIHGRRKAFVLLDWKNKGSA
jgi:hypothetical protein